MTVIKLLIPVVAVILIGYYMASVFSMASFAILSHLTLANSIGL